MKPMKPIQLSIRSNNCSTHTIVTAQWLSNRNEVQKGRRPENVGVYCGCEMPLTNGRGRFFQVRFWLLCCGSHFVTSSEPVKCAFGNCNNPFRLFSSFFVFFKDLVVHSVGCCVHSISPWNSAPFMAMRRSAASSAQEANQFIQ